MTGARLDGTTSKGFTQAHLQSTASYQAKDLQAIGLWDNDLTGWDFSGQDLTGAGFTKSTLTNANLSGANLTGANLKTATLTNANLAGTSVKNAYLYAAVDVTLATVDPTTVYNQWTMFPSDFDPAVAGLTLVMSPAGDLDANDAWNVDDIDMLTSKIAGRDIRTWWLPDAAFDLNGDSVIDLEDHRTWVKDLAFTWYGDADLDLEFNSSDMVQVLQRGKYETGQIAGWVEGDWNGDGVFGSDDMVTAFVDGGYEKGPRIAAVAVPEPTSIVLLVIGLIGLAVCRRPRGL